MNGNLNLIFIRTIILLTTSLLGMPDESCPSNPVCPFDYACESCGPSPINIETDKVQSLNLPILNFLNKYNATATMINTYEALEIIINQPTMATSVNGGPLCDEAYIFQKDRFYWTNNTGQIASDPVDGVGPMVVVESYYFKQTYKTFNNARLHFDGLFTAVTSINVTSEDNQFFDYFQEKVLNVTEPGSTTQLTEGPYDAFFQPKPGLMENAEYYFYKGQYDNGPTGDGDTCSYCNIVAVPKTPASISFRQFYNSFLRLKDVTGRTLQIKTPIFPQGNRTVFVAKGINLTFV